MFEQLGKRMAHVVEGLADHFAREYELQHLGPYDLFETFAAHCIVKRHSQDFEPDELRAGGSCDLGIDAYAVIIDGEVFTDPAEVREYVADHEQIQVRFVVVQAKRRTTFDGQTFVKLANGIAHLFSHEELNIRAGKGARRLRECVRAVYQDTRRFERNGLPRLDVWYASLGRYRPAFHRARREAAYRQLEATKLFRVVEVSGAGAVELRNAYRDTAPGIVATLALPASRRVELPHIPGVKRAFVGVVRARDLVDGVLLDEHQDRRLHLYDENLRDFLGTVRNPVNVEIESSLADETRSQQFAVLNNGVTIVVRSLVASPTDILLRGPRVVNGCQTCNVLAFNRGKLADAVSAIVRATNRQTAITQDSLTARDDFQRHVEDYCASRPDGREVYFERRTGQYGTRPRSRVINRRHLVQSYAAMWLDIPQKVTRYRSLAAGPIFADDHDPLYYYLAATAYLNIGRLLGRGIAPQYRPARFHLLYGVKLLAFGTGGVRLAGSSLDATGERLLDVLWDPSRLQPVADRLLPAVDAALDPADGLSGLGAAVRTELFTTRFQRAVLDLLPPSSEPWPQAA